MGRKDLLVPINTNLNKSSITEKHHKLKLEHKHMQVDNNGAKLIN